MSQRLIINGWSFDPENLLVPADVADMYAVDARTVIRWEQERAGYFTVIRTPGGHRRYSREQVIARMRGDQSLTGPHAQDAEAAP